MMAGIMQAKWLTPSLLACPSYPLQHLILDAALFATVLLLHGQDVLLHQVCGQ